MWLASSPLQIFLGGMLAVNALKVCEPGNEATAASQAELRELLTGGQFFKFLPLALDAAIERREWPLSSGAYHSPARLACLTQTLACLKLGFNDMNAILPLLAKAAENAYHEGASTVVAAALRALLQLSQADVGCLEIVLALTEFRAQVLDEISKTDDEDACALLDYLNACETHIAAARAARDVCLTYCKHAPTVENLSRCFATCACLDQTITIAQATEAVRRVPVGPSSELAVLAYLTSMTFTDFAHQVYGTPEVLGFWPSLMEDIAAEREYMFEGDATLELPGLSDLLLAYELGSSGCTEGVLPDRLLSHVLPSLGLPSDDNLTVEAAFDEVKFEPPMVFKPFARWVHHLCLKLKQASEPQAEQ